MLEKITPYIGWAGFVTGLITASFALLPGSYQFYAIFTMFPGFLLSSFYILMSTRYRIVNRLFNPGYIGMALNSIPLILIVYFSLSK